MSDTVELLLYFISFLFGFLLVFLHPRFLLALLLLPLFFLLLVPFLVSLLGSLLIPAVHQFAELLIVELVITGDVKLLEGGLHLFG